jgi:predicted nucleotidyltransferase
MSEDLQREVMALVNRINEVALVERIYLFGSFAYGEPNEDSDLDLCIITDDTNIRKRDLIRAIRKSISNVATMPVDILVYNKDDFQKRANLETTLEYKIKNEGVKVFEQ